MRIYNRTVVINIKSPSTSLYRWMYNNDTCIIIWRPTNDYNCRNKRGMICWGTPCLYSRPLMNDSKNSWAFLPERPRIIYGVNTLSLHTNHDFHFRTAKTKRYISNNSLNHLVCCTTWRVFIEYFKYKQNNTVLFYHMKEILSLVLAKKINSRITSFIYE